MKYNLPKGYLSYSAIDLWRKDRDGFRRRYYENEKTFDNIYTMFGREVHEAIDREEKYTCIRLPKAEHKIQVDIGGVQVLAYIDTFDPETCAFGEYKSGIRKPDGSPRWTQKDVDKHDQLPFYSLLIQKKYSKKVNKTYLVWLETAKIENKTKRGGVVLDQGDTLALTGHYETFNRKILQRDRDRILRQIKKTAREISKDYTTYKQEHDRN